MALAIPLNNVHGLNDEQRRILRRYSCTSVQDLHSLLMVNRAALGRLLRLADGDLDSLGDEVNRLLPASYRAAMARQAGRRYALGALDPALLG